MRGFVGTVSALCAGPSLEGLSPQDQEIIRGEANYLRPKLENGSLSGDTEVHIRIKKRITKITFPNWKRRA